MTDTKTVGRTWAGVFEGIPLSVTQAWVPSSFGAACVTLREIPFSLGKGSGKTQGFIISKSCISPFFTPRQLRPQIMNFKRLYRIDLNLTIWR